LTVCVLSRIKPLLNKLAYFSKIPILFFRLRFCRGNIIITWFRCLLEFFQNKSIRAIMRD